MNLLVLIRWGFRDGPTSNTRLGWLSGLILLAALLSTLLTIIVAEVILRSW